MRTTTVREVAVVTVSEPVSGSKRRKAPVFKTPRVAKVHHVKVRQDLMKVVKQMQKPNQEMIIESATCVILVNRRN